MLCFLRIRRSQFRALSNMTCNWLKQTISLILSLISFLWFCFRNLHAGSMVQDLACFALFLAHDHGPNLSFLRWRRCYKFCGSFPVYLTLEEQKRSNALVRGKKWANPALFPRMFPGSTPSPTPTPTPPGVAADKCIIFSDRLISPSLAYHSLSVDEISREPFLRPGAASQAVVRMSGSLRRTEGENPILKESF